MSKNKLEEKCHEIVEINEPMFEDDDEHRIMVNVSRGRFRDICTYVWG